MSGEDILGSKNKPTVILNISVNDAITKYNKGIHCSEDHEVIELIALGNDVDGVGKIRYMINYLNVESSVPSDAAFCETITKIINDNPTIQCEVLFHLFERYYTIYNYKNPPNRPILKNVRDDDGDDEDTQGEDTQGEDTPKKLIPYQRIALDTSELSDESAQVVGLRGPLNMYFRTSSSLPNNFGPGLNRLNENIEHANQHNRRIYDVAQDISQNPRKYNELILPSENKWEFNDALDALHIDDVFFYELVSGMRETPITVFAFLEIGSQLDLFASRSSLLAPYIVDIFVNENQPQIDNKKKK